MWSEYFPLGHVVGRKSRKSPFLFFFRGPWPWLVVVVCTWGAHVMDGFQIRPCDQFSQAIRPLRSDATIMCFRHRFQRQLERSNMVEPHQKPTRKAKPTAQVVASFGRHRQELGHLLPERATGDGLSFPRRGLCVAVRRVTKGTLWIRRLEPRSVVPTNKDYAFGRKTPAE